MANTSGWHFKLSMTCWMWNSPPRLWEKQRARTHSSRRSLFPRSTVWWNHGAWRKQSGSARIRLSKCSGRAPGGFGDCLLQRGAQRVHAVDVGAGQLDWKLRNDPRVVVHEGLNARYLELRDIGEPVDLATLDVSFISVTLILPAVARLLRPVGRIVILVKPQFEVGKGQVGKGGIVRR